MISFDQKAIRTSLIPSGASEPEKGRVLDVYKLYVEMADRLSARRQVTNSFYLSLNSAAAALLGYVVATKDPAVLARLLWLVAPAGILLALLWRFQLHSYRNLGGAKFAVIQALEDFLGVRPYRAEWDALDKGQSSKYRPFTHLENAIPWLFVALYAIAFAWHVPWSALLLAIRGT